MAATISDEQVRDLEVAHLRKLKAGTRVVETLWPKPMRFLGWTNDTRLNDVPVHATWDDVRKATDLKTFKDLDRGHDVRPIFRYEDDTDCTWYAYRYNGFWAVGSSAERLQLRLLPEEQPAPQS